MCIDRVEGKFPIRTILVDVGTRRPLGIGVGSMALIAFLPEEELNAMLAKNAQRYPQYKNLTEKDPSREIFPNDKAEQVNSRIFWLFRTVTFCLPNNQVSWTQKRTRRKGKRGVFRNDATCIFTNLVPF